MTAEVVIDHWEAQYANESSLLGEEGLEPLRQSVDFSETPKDIDKFIANHEAAIHPNGIHGNIPRLALYGIQRVYARIGNISKRNADYSVDRNIARYINGRLMAIAGIETEAESIPANLISNGMFEICSDAEGFFAKAIEQVNKGGDYGQPLVSVYHDDNGRPLAFRKLKRSSSALNLEQMQVAGIIVPKGTIIRVGQDKTLTQTGEVTRNGHKVQTYLVDGKLSISPLRIGAWAYEDALDRALFATTSYKRKMELNRNKSVPLKKYTWEDFTSAADKAMEMCGVVRPSELLAA
jgi:hypothetical protein